MLPPIEGEVVEGSVELVAQGEDTRLNLFGTDDPTAVVAKATAVADSLKDVLKQRGLTNNIQGKEYVRVEGWTLLGSMLGVFPVCTWTREIQDGWEARVEARTLSGAVVGAAEAQCSRSEKTWSKRDDYALRSMAQTRATSKALRQPLGFVVTMAGYEATPSEEMPSPEPAGKPASAEPKASEQDPSPPPPAAPEELGPKDKCAHGAWIPAPREGFEMCAACGKARQV